MSGVRTNAIALPIVFACSSGDSNIHEGLCCTLLHFTRRDFSFPLIFLQAMIAVGPVGHQFSSKFQFDSGSPTKVID
jgi:hypothetical protein